MEYPVGVGNLVSKLTLELGTGNVVEILMSLGRSGGLTSRLIGCLPGTLSGSQKVFSEIPDGLKILAGM